MNEQQLNQLESDTGLRLPADYRKVLLNYPQDLIDMADVYPAGKGPPQRYGPDTAELYREETLLRWANVDQREYRLEIFPSSFFIIGESGCGDYYGIDCNEESSAVFMSGCHNVTRHWQETYYGSADRGSLPEPDFHEEVADSLDAWISSIRKNWMEYRQTAVEDTEADVHRKQKLNTAILQAEDAFRLKDYARVVRLLTPFQDKLSKTQAAKLSIALKKQ